MLRSEFSCRDAAAAGRVTPVTVRALGASPQGLLCCASCAGPASVPNAIQAGVRLENLNDLRRAGRSRLHHAARAEVLCTALADAATGQCWCRKAAATSAPATSTFKIPIALMGFDAGVLHDEHSPALPFREGLYRLEPGVAPDRRSADVDARLRGVVLAAGHSAARRGTIRALRAGLRLRQWRRPRRCAQARRADAGGSAPRCRSVRSNSSISSASWSAVPCRSTSRPTR